MPAQHMEDIAMTQSASTTALQPDGTPPVVPKGAFHVTHLKDGAFERGLRPYFEYRDLGMARATDGKVLAQVIRAAGPGERGDLHYHVLDFQMVYVLKGWAQVEFPTLGKTVRLAEGSCMYQEPGIHHRVLEYSDDYTVIEITIPADFPTVTVAP
jgi:quercetin dioxygenase-like cupin family protein